MDEWSPITIVTFKTKYLDSTPGSRRKNSSKVPYTYDDQGHGVNLVDPQLRDTFSICLYRPIS